MKQTSKPRHKRHPARWLSLLLAVALCVVTFLPAAVNRTINRMMHTAMISGNGTFKLHHVGLTSSNFSVVFASNAPFKTPFAKIDSCVLEYRPLRLLRGKIDTVNIRGFSLLTTVTNGTIEVPAIALFSKTKAHPATAGTFTLNTLRKLPISITSIVLDGYVLLEMQSECQAIPIRLQADSMEDRKWEKIALIGNASLASVQLSGSLIVDTITETLTATLNGTVSTDALPYTLREKLPEAIKQATATLNARGGIQLNGTALSAFTCNTDLEINADTTAGNIVCAPQLDFRGNTRRIEGTISGIEATLNNLPFRLDATNVVWLRKAKTLDGRIRLRIADNTPLSVDVHTDPMNTEAGISNPANGWDGTVNVSDMAVVWTGARVTATGNTRTPTALIPPLLTTFSLNTLTLKNEQAETLLHFPNGLSGHAEIETFGTRITGNATLNVPSAVLPKHALAVRNIMLDGKSKLDPDGVRHLDANLRTTAAFRNVEFASFNANLWQRAPRHYRLNTSVNTLGITGHVESVISTATPQGVVMSNTLAIAEQTLDLSNVSNIFPETADMIFSGKLSADAHYTIQPGKHTGAIQGQLTKGTVEWPEKNFSVSDIHLTVDLPALPTLRSHGQFLGFKNVNLGRIAIDSGVVIFRIQDLSTWYLNNLILDWCGGKIRGESTRISRNNEKTRITLHANRILLPALLEQLGIGIDSGEGGRMNGSLPILIENGRITVTDGFLYSTPGVVSRMKLTPAASLQRTAATSIELSLAVDALSNFTYSWLRLSVDSNEDDLNIKFEMDGRPAKKLYYTLSDGTLIKTRHANTFKGLSLDSTFRLPLTEILSIAMPFSNAQRSSEPEEKTPMSTN